MAIIAKEGTGKAFEPCPAGSQAACCVDVVDLGMVENTRFPNEDGTPKMQHKVEVVWESSETMENGKPYLVKKRYTLSLADKANLRHDLESWRGKPFSEAERQGFDVEKLIGAPCILNVIHKAGSKGGVTFANVATVSPLMKGMTRPVPSGGYVRVCEREAENPADADDFPVDAPDVDDIGF